jgi:hypothetical protein
MPSGPRVEWVEKQLNSWPTINSDNLVVLNRHVLPPGPISSGYVCDPQNYFNNHFREGIPIPPQKGMGKVVISVDMPGMIVVPAVASQEISTAFVGGVKKKLALSFMDQYPLPFSSMDTMLIAGTMDTLRLYVWDEKTGPTNLQNIWGHVLSRFGALVKSNEIVGGDQYYYHLQWTEDIRDIDRSTILNEIKVIIRERLNSHSQLSFAVW